MFFTLLLATLGIAIVVSTAAVMLFNKPIGKILKRIVKNEISDAWHWYITFAGFVVGVSGGVRIYDLERYSTQRSMSRQRAASDTEYP